MTDIQDLVRRLRNPLCVDIDGDRWMTSTIACMEEAADALDALWKEVEELRGLLINLCDAIDASTTKKPKP